MRIFLKDFSLLLANFDLLSLKDIGVTGLEVITQVLCLKDNWACSSRKYGLPRIPCTDIRKKLLTILYQICPWPRDFFDSCLISLVDCRPVLDSVRFYQNNL